MVDYGFPWDTNTGLLVRSPGFSSLAIIPPSIPMLQVNQSINPNHTVTIIYFARTMIFH